MANISVDDVPVRFSPFSQRSLNEINIVCIDHNYAKPWSSHPDASNAEPLRMLFMDEIPRSINFDTESQEPLDIDVEGDSDTKVPMYDVPRAQLMMQEGEKIGASLCSELVELKDDWEEDLASIRGSCSVLQNRIFAKMIKILQADRLARLAVQGSKNEPIQRRLQIDKAAKRVRQAFANVGWDMTLILWLHNLFLENLRGQLFVSYLEILQTLKAKIPNLTEKLIIGTTSKRDTISTETLSGYLKKGWDPVVSSISQQKLKKLPENPILLVIPSAPSRTPNPLASKRHKFWHSQLSSMGKVINVIPINTSTNISIANCVENMIAVTKSKVLEVKGHYPGRPVVLIGWEVGAVVACHVAQMELVQAIVCLGFPTTGISGHRWDIDDQIYLCKTRTLFVVGQHANDNCLDLLEEIREKLRVETGMVVVGGADNHLRMGRAKKKNCSVTQAVVDRCILEEMFDFLGRTLTQAALQPDMPVEVEAKKPRKRKQKDLIEGSLPSGPPKKQMSMKIPKGIHLTDSDKPIVSGQLPSTGTAKIGKKTSKKRPNKMAAASLINQKPVLHVNLSVPVDTETQSPKAISAASTSTNSEAAAIASAPELSNLLQNIKTSQAIQVSAVLTGAGSAKLMVSQTSPSKPPASSSVSISSPCATSVATTTALTLSRFLASSGFLRNTATTLRPEDELNVSSPSPDSAEKSVSTDTDINRQQPQIVIRTSGAGESFSLPYFSMSSKGGVKQLSGQASMASCPSTPSSCDQIQQLLCATSSTVTSQTRTTLSGGTLAMGRKDSTMSILPVSTTTSAASPLHSPGASVINIDSDTVFMKESLPSSSPAPGTVSIDLGQIASSSLKLSPKVSLMPMAPPLSQAAASSHANNAVTSSKPIQFPPRPLRGLTEPQGSTKASSILTTNSIQPPQPKQRLSTLPSNFITLQLSPSKDSSQNPSSILSATAKDEPDGVVRSLGHTITSKPQLKLSCAVSKPPSVSSVVPCVSSSESYTKLSSAVSKPLSASSVVPSVSSSENYTKLSCVVSKPLSASSIAPSISISESYTKISAKPPATLSKFSTTTMEIKPQQTLSKFSTTNLASLILNSGRPGSAVSSSILPLAKAVSSASPSASVKAPSSVCEKPQVVMVGTSEPLGKVSSLLESSPITTGEVKKALTQPTTTAPPISPTVMTGHSVSSPKVMTGHPVSSPRVTTGQSMSSPKVPMGHPVSSPKVTTGHPVSNTKVTIGHPGPKVTTGHSVSSPKVTTGHAVSSPKPQQSPTVSPSPASSSKAGKAVASSYTATPKPVLPTIASTRTRRIKTPKQYDL